MKFWRNVEIESRAEERLQHLERVLGRPLSPPIPVDRFVEEVLELDFLWEDIEELDCETILAGIRPRDRLIVLNDRHQALLSEKIGLERFTKLHEGGHWDLFVDKSILDHPELFSGSHSGISSFRQSNDGAVVVLNSLCISLEAQEHLCELRSRADDPNERRAVNRYAGAILMPRSLLRHETLRRPPRAWRDLYEIARRFGVTISALKVRLSQLDLLHVGEDGRFYRSKAEAVGQGQLFS